MSRVASTANQTRTVCGRWAGRWAAISAMASAMAPSSPWETPVAHLATGLAIYAYLPMNPCRLPQPSPADWLFFTDASGESALTLITGGATLQLTHTGGHYHMDHHTGWGWRTPLFLWR